jgi:hypothetical protein
MSSIKDFLQSNDLADLDLQGLIEQVGVLSAEQDQEALEVEAQYKRERKQELIEQEAEIATQLEKRKKLDIWSSTYTKADRILTERDVSVVVENMGVSHIPAWNNGKVITINAKAIKEVMTNEAIVSLHGVNYHEVAHILYTPRSNSEIIKWANANSFGIALNVLEDNRIEALITKKYPSVVPFLTACIYDYLLSDEYELGELYPIIKGRKYIPLDIRQKVADGYIAKHGLQKAKEVSRLVNEYITIAYPKDTAKAKTIVEQFAKLFMLGNADNHNKQNDSDGKPDPNGCNHRTAMKHGRPESDKKQSDLANQSDSGQGEQDEKLESDKGQSPKSDSNDDKNSDKNGELPNAKQESDSQTDSDKNTIRNTISEIARQQLSDLVNRNDIRKEVSEIRRAVAGQDKANISTNTVRHENYSVSPQFEALSKKFGRELERLRAENDPMWELEQPSGRLNVQRAVHADINDIGRLFDKWSEGNDNSDIEAVVLIDVSGSMSGVTYDACQSAWVIKRAIENIDGDVTIFTFSTLSKLLYSSNEKAKGNSYRHVWAQQNTNPYEALEEAERIFSLSKRSTKLLIILTDGMWDNAVANDLIINRINKVATSCVAFLGGQELLLQAKQGTAWAVRDLQEAKHGANYFEIISKPIDLVSMARRLVTGLIGRSN